MQATVEYKMERTDFNYWVCSCGALIADKEKHSEWHAEIARHWHDGQSKPQGIWSGGPR